MPNHGSMTKGERIAMREAYYRLCRWADSYTGTHSVSRWMDEMRREAVRHEKEHRAFGRRMLGHSPPRNGWSVEAVAQAFIVRIVWEGPAADGKRLKASDKIVSWAHVQSLRSDYRIGYAIRQAMDEDPGAFEQIFPTPPPHFDYAAEMRA